MRSIFIDGFSTPNAVTWLVLATLLAIAVFIRFSRLLSLRNWDLITLLLLSPGLLIVDWEEKRFAAATVGVSPDLVAAVIAEHRHLTHIGYAWLFIFGGYLVARCLLDLFLTRRPYLEPNLNIAGLASLGISLLAFLMYEVVTTEPDPGGRASARVASKILAGDPTLHNEKASHPTVSAVMVPLAVPIRILTDRIGEQTPLEQSEQEIGVARSTTILCHMLVLIGMVLIGWRHFGSPATGVGVATLYLLLPLTALNIEKIDHLLPSAILVWALYAYKRPLLSGALFGVAGFFLFPLFLLPLWIGFYWRRGASRFLYGFLFVTAGLAVLIWALPALRTFMETWTTSMVWRARGFGPSEETIGFWTQMNEMWRWPILVIYIAAAVAVAFVPKEKNLAELLALSVLLIVAMQFLYADRGGTYIHWYLPYLLLMIFRPNLSEVRPPAVAPANA